MTATRGAGAKRLIETCTARRVHTGTQTMYRAINKSIHDDGGGHVAESTHSRQSVNTAVSRTRRTTTPVVRPAPPQRDQKQEKMISPSERVFSVPGNGSQATPDTRNECTRTSATHAPHLVRYRRLLANALAEVAK